MVLVQLLLYLLVAATDQKRGAPPQVASTFAEGEERRHQGFPNAMATKRAKPGNSWVVT
jgi:hypothetical protein